MTIGAQLTATGRWSIDKTAAGIEDGFAAIRRMRGVLAAWDEMLGDRLVLSVLVFEPNEAMQIDVIDAVLRQFVSDVRREEAPEVPS